MAAARCLRWGLTRAGTWLFPPPARCPRRALHKQVDGTEFQSIYSLDKLYPDSKGSDTAWRVPGDLKQAINDIPLDRLTISYCRSSGPGGQNVNKVNSKAEVRFHLASADWMAEPVRQKIAVRHKNKINRAGELIVTSESSRFQFRNLADCLQKIRDMIAEASQTPKEPSREDAQIQRIRKHESGKAETKENQFCHKDKQEGRCGLTSPAAAKTSAWDVAVTPQEDGSVSFVCGE
ncbi:peptidyl-tRNA hydrolase ICT1, mitochondrial isoform X3 [Dipodomys spectabilis]|uniref:peptidyl-tRNA hydrolase ICT1, mitochondrial isoform X3 n=1 Tax=Dipodomys spectabilis TaxID=105255 RepID=UPI001C547032|nr:peptidyl-tRNA hydrolase ICT1, mitochondrial isoform X3 [Dipodomys spectabilis]